MTQSGLSNVRFAFPPPDEQQQIAAFLDWKTGQVDALIARKQELLEQLKERRLAVITQAVTRGLDLAAPLRDSGIPWLGQVPQHWEVMKFGYRTNIQEGQVNPEEELYLDMPLIAGRITSSRIRTGCLALHPHMIRPRLAGSIRCGKAMLSTARFART